MDGKRCTPRVRILQRDDVRVIKPPPGVGSTSYQALAAFAWGGCVHSDVLAGVTDNPVPPDSSKRHFVL